LKNALNAELGPASAPGPYEKLLSAQRRKMFAAFAAFRSDATAAPDLGTDSILDVESRSSLTHAQSSVLLACADAQDRQRIVSCAIEPVSDPGRMRTTSEGWRKYLRVDGRHLPFADGEFDWVFCGEIIERSGSFEQQYELLAELCRVARKGVFVTTSNRWHPLEFNTCLPFLHWLPADLWRRTLKLSGKSAWASPSGLNLLDAGGLTRLSALLPGKPRHDIGHLRVFGLKSHFFLMISKPVCSGAGWQDPVGVRSDQSA
jgi:hypothetical protein